MIRDTAPDSVLGLGDKVTGVMDLPVAIFVDETEHVGRDTRTKALDHDDGRLVATDFGFVDLKDFDAAAHFLGNLDHGGKLIKRLSLVRRAGMHEPGFASTTVVDGIEVPGDDEANFIGRVGEGRGGRWGSGARTGQDCEREKRRGMNQRCMTDLPRLRLSAGARIASSP